MAYALPEWAAIAPTLVFAATALMLFLIDSVDSDSANSSLLAGTATLGSLLALGVTAWYLGAGTGQTDGAITLFSGSIVVDGMSLFFTFIFATVTTLVTMASYDYVRGDHHEGEYYILVMLAATGMSLMAVSNSLATVFVSLELASLPSYALVAYLKTNRGSVEAGLKYFLIGALSSAIFAYGLSLVYGVTGSMRLPAIAESLSGGAEGLLGVLGLGILMMLGGFAYKTASVPFHFWAPEAYEGAPAPISAFLSSASKAAGFVVAFRVFTVAFPVDTVVNGIGVDWLLAVQILAVVTMTLGNFAAATQDEVKRMLAYSSIGHAGYILIGLAALGGSKDGFVLGMSMFHLLVYGFMNTGAFLFIAMVEHWGVGRRFEDYNGLGSRAPVASLAMTVFMFSLAGLPPFGGFFSKYFLFAGAVWAGYWWLAAVGAINSALSLFYYSRVVKAMWIEEPTTEFEITSKPLGLYVAVIAAALVTVLVAVAFPAMIETASNAAATLFA